MDEGDEDQAGHGDYGDGAHHLDILFGRLLDPLCSLKDALGVVACGLHRSRLSVLDRFLGHYDSLILGGCELLLVLPMAAKKHILRPQPPARIGQKG